MLEVVAHDGVDERGFGPRDRHEQHLDAERAPRPVGAGERVARRRRSGPRRGAPRARPAPGRARAPTQVVEGTTHRVVGVRHRRRGGERRAASSASSARSRSRMGASTVAPWRASAARAAIETRRFGCATSGSRIATASPAVTSTAPTRRRRRGDAGPGPARRSAASASAGRPEPARRVDRDLRPSPGRRRRRPRRRRDPPSRAPTLSSAATRTVTSGSSQEPPEQVLAIRRVHVGEHQRGRSTLGVVGGCGEQASDRDGLGGRVVVAPAGQLTERQQADVAVVVLGEVGEIGRREVGRDGEVEAEPDVAHVVGEQRGGAPPSARRRRRGRRRRGRVHVDAAVRRARGGSRRSR